MERFARKSSFDVRMCFLLGSVGVVLIRSLSTMVGFRVSGCLRCALLVPLSPSEFLPRTFVDSHFESRHTDVRISEPIRNVHIRNLCDSFGFGGHHFLWNNRPPKQDVDDTYFWDASTSTLLSLCPCCPFIITHHTVANNQKNEWPGKSSNQV